MQPAMAKRALRAILRARPELIVTDSLMPGIDGIELVRTSRNKPSTATIPILLISGQAPEEGPWSASTRSKKSSAA